MPAPPTLKIIEIFPSIQGEGMRQGEPTVFVRLAGCDLRCSFCDTKYAWEGGAEYGVDKILENVQRVRRRFPARWVCLTGGEPFMQDVRLLVRLLKRDRCLVQVETNGTRFYSTAADWLTVSPKPKDYLVRPEFQRLAKEVKLVVTRELDLAIIRRIRAAFPGRIPVLLQPESNRRWSQKRALSLIKQVLAAGLDNIRISAQLHKVMGLR
jgi:7-cyano-7-deazaguanosine (preQ0) biosynthesis protein QueE